MPKKIDLTGQRFGKWTVLREATKEEKNNRPSSYWLCQCDCGNKKIVNGQVLRRGTSKSCGCLRNELQAKQMINKKFGLLTVIELTSERDSSGGVMWKCQCECGNIVNVSTNHLNKGDTKSCGCVGKQKLIEYNHTRMIDIKNKKFGLLTALYPNGSNNNGDIIWHCKCECGNECDISGRHLRTGHTRSCGCERYNSYGELKINQILKDNNINFIQEYRPPKDKTLSFDARFDFYIPDKNYLIEYDGIQHFQLGVGNFDNPEKFKITQEHDAIKNQWCKDNNIPLIRIPYTHYNNLCLEDLLLETSNFLI